MLSGEREDLCVPSPGAKRQGEAGQTTAVQSVVCHGRSDIVLNSRVGKKLCLLQGTKGTALR